MTTARPEIFTRQEYMQASREDGPAAHRRYYAQFVNEQTKAALLRSITKAEIVQSTNPHHNDIPLVRWDDCPLILARRLETAGDYLTKAVKVCILKEAARQICEESKAQNAL